MTDSTATGVGRWRNAPAEELSEVIVAASSHVVVSDGQIVEVSPQAAAELGVSGRELVGRPLRDLAFDPRADASIRELVEGSRVVEATALPDLGGVPVTVRRLGGVGQTVVFEIHHRVDGEGGRTDWADLAVRAVSEASSLGVFTVTQSGAILFATNFVHELIRALAPTEQFDGVIDPDAILGIFTDECRDLLFDAFRRGFHGETVEVTAQTVATNEQWLRLSLSPAPGDAVVSVVQDVTDLIRAERKLRESTRLLEALDTHSDDLVLVFDADGQSRFVSSSVQRMAGHEGSVSRRDALSVVHPQDVVAMAELYEQTTRTGPGAMGQSTTARARIVVDESVGYRWHDITVSNLLHDPDIRGVVWTIRDSHDRHAAELELAHRATHDELTDLPERTALLEFLELALSDDQPGRHTAVLFCDVDNFKDVNDRLGHAAGDVLLTVIADRLRGAVRDGDLVARYGGDEFVIVAPALEGFDEAVALAERVFAAFRGRVHFAGMEVDVGVSVGVATSTGAQSAEALIQQADIAMYEAKRNGRGRIEAFTDALSEYAALRARTEAELSDAVEHGELLLHYQPLVRLGAGADLVVGVEALARWQHPDDGLIGPDRFLGVAEDSGFMSVLGMELLRIVMGDIASWPGAVPDFFAVNMSTRQLSDQLLALRLLAMMDEHGVDPSLMRVETPESSFQADSTPLRNLEAFHRAGVRVFLDDFGTGHSSITVMHRFPVAGIKIDGTFVRPEVDADFVRLVVGVAHTLGIETVAEGIETPEQLEAVRALDVDYAQGFLLGRPSPLP